MVEQTAINAEKLVWAYCNGVFPMAETRNGTVNWYSPDPRAILPLDQFHVSKSLRRRLKNNPFEITHDQAFREVMTLCAKPRGYERDTWINDEIISGYSELHEMGLAHSVEAWQEESGERKLVGGLYGVTIGGAYFGESMFSRATDASKVCLAHLVDHMNDRGYTLLDVQFNSSHMAQFGVIDIPRDDYLKLLRMAIQQTVRWA